MTGSTKILTVSYGTFSCTLEGFDDPFGTMRGIAEYFRDLAADDRYFGAEPPTPDVEMLQRIAEKEVQRRVEAKIGEGRVALTQVTGDAAEAEPEEVKPQAEVPRERPRPVAPVVTEDEDLDHGPLTHDDEYLLSDEPEDVLAVDPDAALPPGGPAETVAEKLRRIRAVVSRSIEQEDDRSFSEEKAAAAEAEDAEGAPAKRERALTETIRQISADLADDEDAPSDDMPEEAEAEAAADDVSEDRSDAADEGWDFDTDGLAGPNANASEDDEYEDEAPARTDEDDAVVARVVSEARDAAAAEAASEEDEDQPESAAVADEPPQSSSREARPSKPLTPISEEGEDVGRLMAETDQQLNTDESVRRRRVISQMRAAVAATKADRLVSRRVVSREDADAAERAPYRNDLSDVVREVSRPAPAKESERRPSVAPLVLVSSQRVTDTPEPEDDAPQDFAGFARSMGAKELTDLLEAAAAYTAYVEGQSSFSRPEIMKRVARVDPALQVSREDGLRSFGQLLRQGKLQKLERGQFTVTESTRYKPGTRIAGE